MSKVAYLGRIFSAYVLKKNSQLSFWHETPEAGSFSPNDPSGSYYMTFADKTKYQGPFDENGIPLLDYHGHIGRQYNPIAIAQYGLGYYNLYKKTGSSQQLDKAMAVSDWLADNLEQNSFGQWVWHHKFDWEYFRTLKSPWYSALAQGQGISALIRVYKETNDTRYRDAAERAFATLLTPVKEGGVLHIDSEGYWWLEEYIVDPPTHILNGFIWALWGVYDYMLLTGSEDAKKLWDESVKTLMKNIDKFERGCWSLYDLSPTRICNVASSFYHSLHIVQLRVMSSLTGNAYFNQVADRWDGYRQNSFYCKRALFQKAAFKLLYF